MVRAIIGPLNLLSANNSQHNSRFQHQNGALYVLNRVINSCTPAVLPPPSEHIAIIDNPEELKCGADCSQKSGAMGIEWVFWLLLIDPESPLINAYSILSNQN